MVARLLGIFGLFACLSLGHAYREPAVAFAPLGPPAPLTSMIEGNASYYGKGDTFAGRPTASGEIFDPAQLTAAHKTLPLGTVLRVTNPATERWITVRVNDRGPYIEGRVLDLSHAAALALGTVKPGVAPVRIEVLSTPSRLHRG